MGSAFDHLQVIFWTLTYILIVFFGIKYRQDKKIMIPYLAGGLNLAWEINAIIVSGGFYGHVLWLTLDVVIFLININTISNKKGYSILYILIVMLLTVVLRAIFTLDGGMLISSFVIDFAMQLLYMIRVKRISPQGKLFIAITKMLGDLFAWLYYAQMSMLIGFIGALVFIFNMFYLAYCIEEKYKKINVKGR